MIRTHFRTLIQVAWVVGAIALLPAYRTAPTVAAISHGSAIAQSAYRSQELVGTVIGYGEADENEWILQTASGVVLVDAGPLWYHTIPVAMGETLTVVGEFDNGEFDAFSITRADGTVVPIRDPQGPPPWAGGPNRRR